MCEERERKEIKLQECYQWQLQIVDFDFNSENKILIRVSKSDIESGELKDILARVKVIKKNGDIVELEFPAAFCVVRG